VVVGVDGVVEVRVVTVVVVGAGVPAAAVVGGLVVVVDPGGLPDPEVEVETGVVGAVGVEVVVVGVLAVVVDGGLVVVVDVLVTVAVVVDALTVVVDDVVDAPLPAQELMSVTTLRSILPAAGPSWLVTAASSSLWLVTPAGTVTPGIGTD
jgi:hypothetical protein